MVLIVSGNVAFAQVAPPPGPPAPVGPRSIKVPVCVGEDHCSLKCDEFADSNGDYPASLEEATSILCSKYAQAKHSFESLVCEAMGCIPEITHNAEKAIVRGANPGQYPVCSFVMKCTTSFACHCPVEVEVPEK